MGNKYAHCREPSTGTVGFVGRGLYVDPGRDVGIKVNQDFSLVENCEIHISLETFNNVGTIFRKNLLYGSDSWGSTITTKGGTRNVQVYNNVIHLTNPSWNEGLVLGGYSGTQWDFEPSVAVECYNCAAWNNVVINDTATRRNLYLMVGCKDCVMLNNVGINGTLEHRGGGGPRQPPSILLGKITSSTVMVIRRSPTGRQRAEQ